MQNSKWQKSIALFLTAQTISLFGSSLVQYAIIWHITLSTSSGKMLTIATLCGFLPQILTSLFAGVWLDKYNRKTLIMLSDSLIAFATLALAIAFLTGHDNIAFLFIALIIRSVGTGVQTPAVNAIIPQIVPEDSLLKINGANSTLASLMMFISPAASGAILSFAPLGATLLIDVATAIIGISITASIPIRPYSKKTASGSSYLDQIKAGFSYLRSNRFIRKLLSFQIVILFLISPSAFLTPLLVSRSFGPEIWRLTASEMTYSLGMILGGLLVVYLGGFKNKLNLTLLAGFTYGFLMLGLGLAPIFWAYLIANALIGITAPCYNAPITATIQKEVEPHMQGRIFSLMQISTSCALPLGMALFGPLADLIKIQTIFMGAGGIVILFVLYTWRQKTFDN